MLKYTDYKWNSCHRWFYYLILLLKNWKLNILRIVRHSTVQNCYESKWFLWPVFVCTYGLCVQIFLVQIFPIISCSGGSTCVHIVVSCVCFSKCYGLTWREMSLRWAMIRFKKIYKSLLLNVIVIYSLLLLVYISVVPQELETILTFENSTWQQLSDEVFILSAYLESRHVKNSPFVRVITISK